ncbi:MAG TPA: glycosyltransferase family 2 protein, partial [Candidatus Eisenbacteria bacterium]|nr:glycosyltransferase family 2 protein [Candidatus Eisenbacteria bacterium]
MAGLTPSDVCVVIPAYNEGAHVAGVVARVREKGYPVVVVDDGSTDDTVRLCRASGATVLEASRNQGKGAAMKRGFEWFLGADAPRRYEALIFMDADGQHDPADLTRFLEALSGGGALIL